LPYSLNDLACDVPVLLDALDLPSAHIVGMSMGGFIAQLLALNAPQRVRSLTLLMTSSGNPDLPGPSPEAQALLQRRSAPIVNRDALIEAGVLNQQALASPGYPTDAGDVRTRVAAEIDRAYDPGGYLRQRAAILADGDRRDRIRAIDRPTLVLHGEDDPLINVAAGRELAQLIPGAILATYPGMAHEIPAGLAARVADDIAAFVRRIGPC
jgi:pimeloyl-ACP methyl ester carboxylesterase